MAASANNVVTAINNVPADQGLQVYPNPVTEGKVYIRTKDLYTSYTVADAMGRILYNGALRSTPGGILTIAMEGLPGGIYWIKLQGRNKEREVKVVVR